MDNSYSQKMKTAIVNDLQSLVDSGVLKSVVSVDYSKQFVNDYTWPGFPSALVIPPTISTSEYEDTATNVREYTWNILIVTTTDNLPSTDPTYLEGLVDAVLNVFDLDCTLQGSSVAAVMPAILEPPGPVSSNSITYVTFYCTLKARALVTAGVKIN
jgi:hypothetical protein